MYPEWTQRPDNEAQWERLIDAKTYCAITNYSGSNEYCCHVIRGEARLHSIISGREAAMKKADEIMAMPIDEFNARAVAKLVDEIRSIERTIMSIAPSTEVLPGYHAGFEDGVANVRRTIATALDIVDERLEWAR